MPFFCIVYAFVIFSMNKNPSVNIYLQIYLNKILQNSFIPFVLARYANHVDCFCLKNENKTTKLWHIFKLIDAPNFQRPLNSSLTKPTKLTEPETRNRTQNRPQLTVKVPKKNGAN